MSAADPFAYDLEDMVVDLVQKQLEAAKLKSNRSTHTWSTLVNISPRSSTSSGTGTASATATGGGSQLANP